MISRATLSLCAVLACVASGCAGSPMITRGQEPGVTQAGYGTQPELKQAIPDHYRYNEASRYEEGPNGPVPARPLSHLSGPHHQRHAAPSHAGCPACQGSPPGPGPCPKCGCPCQDPDGGSHGHFHDMLYGQNFLDQYPQHHFTYSYHRPKNLTYPPPQVPGGAVVYPYYTLKGPSCFFRQ